MCFEMYTIKTDKGQRFTEEIVKLIRMSTTKYKQLTLKLLLGENIYFTKKKKLYIPLAMLKRRNPQKFSV